MAPSSCPAVTTTAEGGFFEVPPTPFIHILPISAVEQTHSCLASAVKFPTCPQAKIVPGPVAGHTGLIMQNARSGKGGRLRGPNPLIPPGFPRTHLTQNTSFPSPCPTSGHHLTHQSFPFCLQSPLPSSPIPNLTIPNEGEVQALGASWASCGTVYSATQAAPPFQRAKGHP